MKRLLLCAAIAALCVSCSPSPYDAALSDSAKTVLKLTKDTGSGVSLNYNQATVPQDLTYYPRVTPSGFDYTIGFTCGSEGSDIVIRAVAFDAGSQMLQNFGFQSETIPNQDSRYPTWTAWPTKDVAATDAYFFLLTFDALYPLSDNRLSLLKGQAIRVMSPIDSVDLHNRVNANLGYDVVILGASVEASTFVVNDMTFWLAWDITNSDYAEFSSAVSSSPINVASIRTISYHYTLSFIPPGLTHVQYFHDMNEAGDPARFPNASFASWYDTTAGKWICYRWAEWPVSSGIYPSTQLPIDHRIDALLSTGQLLSTEGGTGRLYDRDGNLLATFPMGSLRFLSEEYVGAVARTYFTQCLTYDNKVHFVTYYIRTSDLATLGN